MIARKVFLSSISFLTIWVLSYQAWAEELNDKYLLGKWAIQGADCSDPASEFVTFRDTGAVEDVRAGKLEAAGFWEISDEMLTVNIVASPAFFHGVREEAVKLKAFEDKYYAFRIRVVPFDIEADRFSSIGILGEQVIKGEFNRCKS